MNQFLAPDVVPSPYKRYIHFGMSFILLILFAAVMVFGYRSLLALSMVSGGNKAKAEAPAGTLSLIYTQKGDSVSKLYTLDLSTDAAVAQPGTENMYDHAQTTTGESVSTFNTPEGSYLSLVSPVGTLKITPIVPGEVRRVDINPEGNKFVFEVLVPLVQPEGSTRSQLVLYDVPTKTQIVLTEGKSPVFFDTNSILFLKEDGVYSIDTTQTSDTPVVNALAVHEKYKTGFFSEIVLAPNRKHVTITYPELGTNFNYSIEKKGGAGISLTQFYGFLDTSYSAIVAPDSLDIASVKSVIREDESAGLLVTVTSFKTKVSTFQLLVGVNTARPVRLVTWIK